MDSDETYLDPGISRQTREIIMRLDRINDTLMRIERRVVGDIPAAQNVWPTTTIPLDAWRNMFQSTNDALLSEET